MIPLANAIEVTLENPLKSARSVVFAPITVMAVICVSFTTTAALATDTSVMVRPVLVNLPFALLNSA